MILPDVNVLVFAYRKDMYDPPRSGSATGS